MTLGEAPGNHLVVEMFMVKLHIPHRSTLVPSRTREECRITGCYLSEIKERSITLSFIPVREVETLTSMVIYPQAHREHALTHETCQFGPPGRFSQRTSESCLGN